MSNNKNPYRGRTFVVINEHLFLLIKQPSRDVRELSGMSQRDVPGEFWKELEKRPKAILKKFK